MYSVGLFCTLLSRQFVSVQMTMLGRVGLPPWLWAAPTILSSQFGWHFRASDSFRRPQSKAFRMFHVIRDRASAHWHGLNLRFSPAVKLWMWSFLICFSSCVSALLIYTDFLLTNQITKSSKRTFSSPRSYPFPPDTDNDFGRQFDWDMDVIVWCI